MQDQLRLFFDWLVEIIVEKEIDLLLVSGDVFDYANPAAEDRRMYFEFLRRLIDTETKIIITGGNHDSAGFLNAPKEILEALDITVIGEATANISDEMVEVLNSDGNCELAVAAVPFLKDKDLRHRDEGHKYQNRTEEIRAGIERHYSQLAEICQEQYAEVPVIAMGHLYTIGADPSESERDIHMGNAAAVDSRIFSTAFDYVALGHIHRPQIIGKNDYIRYSGSPVALSFSEKKDIKSIILLEVEDGKLKKPELLQVPKTRELKRISGNLKEVKEQLSVYRPALTLPSFLELVVKEKSFNTTILGEMEELKQVYQDHPHFRIIKDKIEFEEGAKDISELFQGTISIEELKPLEVFEKKIEHEVMDAELIPTLKDAFLELLEQMDNED